MPDTPPPLSNPNQTPTTIQQAFNFLLALSKRGITLEVVHRDDNRVKYRLTITQTGESFIAEMPENAQKTQSPIILPTGHRSR